MALFSCNKQYMVFSQSPDEDAAMKAVDEAFKRGVNFFDVAPFYASGDAERVRDFINLMSFFHCCL